MVASRLRRCIILLLLLLLLHDRLRQLPSTGGLAAHLSPMPRWPLAVAVCPMPDASVPRPSDYSLRRSELSGY